jgi:hypothetical protein
LTILTSSDKLFRIYSWDTWTGGTMHFFENVMQYNSGGKTKASIDTPQTEGDVRPAFSKIFTFTTGEKTYYLSNYYIIESSRCSEHGMIVFTIENAKIVEAKIIKTHSGIFSKLSYEYDVGMNDDYDNRSEIHFNNINNTIYLPLVNSKGRMTDKFILYKFTGQYFGRVKN